MHLYVYICIYMYIYICVYTYISYHSISAYLNMLYYVVYIVYIYREKNEKYLLYYGYIYMYYICGTANYISIQWINLIMTTIHPQHQKPHGILSATDGNGSLGVRRRVSGPWSMVHSPYPPVSRRIGDDSFLIITFTTQVNQLGSSQVNFLHSDHVLHLCCVHSPHWSHGWSLRGAIFLKHTLRKPIFFQHRSYSSKTKFTNEDGVGSQCNQRSKYILHWKKWAQ